MISRKMMTKILCRKFGKFQKNGFKKDLLACAPHNFFHVSIINKLQFFSFNLELICTRGFFKKLKLHSLSSSSCNFNFLKNSLMQIDSKLNSKLYDYPILIFIYNSTDHYNIANLINTV